MAASTSPPTVRQVLQRLLALDWTPCHTPHGPSLPLAGAAHAAVLGTRTLTSNSGPVHGAAAASPATFSHATLGTLRLALGPRAQALLRTLSAAGARAFSASPAIISASAVGLGGLPKLAVGMKYALGATAVLAGAAFTTPDELRMAYLIPTRLARDVYTAAAIVAGGRGVRGWGGGLQS